MDRHGNSFKDYFVLIWNSDLELDDCKALEATAYNMTREKN